ncbi:hypothetical protein IPZ70_19075 [Streptomyces polychromogenes]|nr:hypothetical protein [Streptomyces polychromogenes]
MDGPLGLGILAGEERGGRVREQAGETRLVVVRRSHPLTVAGTLTARRYVAAKHVAVSRRGNWATLSTKPWPRLGLRRRVVATARMSGCAGRHETPLAPVAPGRPAAS